MGFRYSCSAWPSSPVAENRRYVNSTVDRSTVAAVLIGPRDAVLRNHMRARERRLQATRASGESRSTNFANCR